MDGSADGQRSWINGHTINISIPARMWCKGDAHMEDALVEGLANLADHINSYFDGKTSFDN